MRRPSPAFTLSMKERFGSTAFMWKYCMNSSAKPSGTSLTNQNFVNSQFAAISGNVFNDLDRLTDNTVDGTGTNAGGIYINLVNPTGDLVIASIPVNADGTYSFVPAANYFGAVPVATITMSSGPPIAAQAAAIGVIAAILATRTAPAK